MASTPLLLQDNAGSVVVFLQDSSDGSAATGLADTDVTCDFKKSGAGSFVSKSLTSSNFTEISSGFYEIDFTASELDTVGNFYVRVSGSSIKTTIVSAYVAAEAPTSPVSTPSVNTVAIFGYLKNPDGSVAPGYSISARVLSTPSILHDGDDGLVLTSDLVTTKSDDNGFFTLDLIVGSQVDIFIPGTHYRRTLRIPSLSSNLFDIP